MRVLGRWSRELATGQRLVPLLLYSATISRTILSCILIPFTLLPIPLSSHISCRMVSGKCTLYALSFSERWKSHISETQGAGLLTARKVDGRAFRTCDIFIDSYVPTYVPVPMLELDICNLVPTYLHTIYLPTYLES